jgi:hypothetical protein
MTPNDPLLVIAFVRVVDCARATSPDLVPIVWVIIPTLPAAIRTI